MTQLLAAACPFSFGPGDAGSIPDVTTFCGPQATASAGASGLALDGVCVIQTEAALNELSASGATTCTALQLDVADELDAIDVRGLRSIYRLRASDENARAMRFPALVEAENIDVFNNARLEVLEMPQLRTAGHVAIGRNPLLPSCAAEALVGQLENPDAQTELHLNLCDACCDAGTIVDAAPGP